MTAMSRHELHKTGDGAVKGPRRSWAGLLAVSAMLVAAAPAEAEAPRNRGCFGKDVSTYARGGGAGFGQFMAGMAKSSEGVSEEVAYHKAGLVPDALAPNTCND